MLPSFWKPRAMQGLSRMGAQHDGGYVVASGAVEESTLLISMGLNDDWSFEADYMRLASGRVVCLDHSVNRIFWAWYTLHGLVRFSARRATRFLAYRKFFSGENIEHRQTKIGYDVPGETSLRTLMLEFHDRDIFLKIDIEGAEYRILDDIVSNEERITGLAIEFHDVDLNRDRISKFLSTLRYLRITSVHANNFGGVDANGDPLVIEVTLAREEYCSLDGDPTDVTRLETPNNPGIPDIRLIYGDTPPDQRAGSGYATSASLVPSAATKVQERPASGHQTAKKKRGAKHLAQRAALRALREFTNLTMFGRGRLRRTIGYEVLRSQQSLVVCGGPPKETFIVNSRDMIIGRELFISGEFDFGKFITAFNLILKHRPERRPELLIDVGCNIGTICIPAVVRNYVDRAIAVEPDPENCRLFRANLELNRAASRIVLHEVASGVADDETLELELSPFNLGDHRIRTAERSVKEGGTGRKSVAVRSAKLDTICSSHLDSALMVWMDVQGFEGFVLAGSTEILRRRPPMVLEVWPGVILRSGFELIKSSLVNYSSFINLSDPHRTRPISELDFLFEEVEPGMAHTDILIF